MRALFHIQWRYIERGSAYKQSFCSANVWRKPRSSPINGVWNPITMYAVPISIIRIAATGMMTYLCFNGIVVAVAVVPDRLWLFRERSIQP